MDSRELQAIIKAQVQNATGYIGGEITEARREAMRDYLGELLGNEIEGRSQVVSSDVQDVIESVMPDVLQIFTSSNSAVRFDPIGQEDEEAAEQATDYVNHIWNVDNPGFNIFHDWFKDALLQINGIIKVWWDETEKIERRKYVGLTGDQLVKLTSERGVEVLEHSEYLSEDGEEFIKQNGLSPELLPPGIAAQAMLHDVTIKRTKRGGAIKIANVPPEEFLITKRARSLDDARFTCHRTTKTVSELIESGYKRTQLENIPAYDGEEFNEEKVQRFDKEEDWADEADKSTRELRVHECYLNVDWDGDGITELRKVTVAGPAYEILQFENGDEDNEEVEDHPFSAVTPIRMPHKFFGRSLADLTQDIQYLKTSLWRQLLDNCYNINNARQGVSNKVSLDDVMDNKVGAPIRVDTNAPDVAGHIQPIQTAPIGNHIFPALEYADKVRETRSGVNHLSQGLDPDALHSTASGINQLLGRSQQRTLLIAMVFAYGGVREAFRKILRLVTSHQDRSRVVRLRNQWIEVDPREWNSEMDVSVQVGLGRGTQDQRIATSMKVVEATNGLVTLQGGVNGPFVYAHHVRNAYAEFYEAIGLRTADPYISEISEQDAGMLAQQSQQQVSPDQQKLQIEQQRVEQDAAKASQDNELRISEVMLNHQRELMKMGIERGLEEQRMDVEAAIAAAKLHTERQKNAESERTKRITAASRPANGSKG